MKPRILSSARLSLPLASAIAALLAAPSAYSQTTRYWDQNGTTAGFGSATGTWTDPTLSRWSNGTGASAGTATPGASITTLINDPLHFGTDTVALGTGTITVTGTVNAASLRFGSATTGNVTLSGGTINLADTTSIHVGAGSTTVHTIASTITGAATKLTKTGNTLQLSANNSYTGQTIISTGTLILNNSAALGGSNLGVNGTSSISMGANSTLQSNYAPADLGISDSYVYAPITLTAAGTNNFFIGNGSSSAPAESVRFNLSGAIGGTAGANVVFGNTTATRNNADSIIVLGAASNYNGNTTIQAGNTQNRINVTAGVANALPTTTVLSFDAVAGSGTGRTTQYDLNGNNQTLAGLDNGGIVASLRNIRVTNTGALATLNINNTVADYIYGGFAAGTTNTTAQITGAIALTKNGAGTFTLAAGAGNAFTGDTTISGGILVLGQSNSIQNSAFDTTGSIAGDGSNGLRVGVGGTGVTTLTLGGLKGSNNFASRFTSTTGGYTGLTALTLNPGTGVTHSYSSDIGNGNGSMSLSKSGAGTQTLDAAQSYSGATNVSAGILNVNAALTSATYGLSGGSLAIGASDLLPVTSAVTLTGGTLAMGAFDNTVATVSLQSGNITGTGGTLTSTSAFDVRSGTASAKLGGNVGLNKTTSGTVTLSGENSYTGATTVNAGTLTLNHDTQNNSKLSDTAVLALGGGTVSLGGDTGSHTEVVASTTLTAFTASSVTRSGANTATLQLGTITNNTGTINFGTAGLATTNNLNNSLGILGSWATIGGNSWAVNSTNSANGLITEATYTDVTRLDSGTQTIAAGAGHTRIIEGTGLVGDLTMAASGTTAVGTLVNTATTAGTVDIGTGNTLSTSVILQGTGAGALTVGISATPGSLTALTAGGDLSVVANAAITINSTITDNTSASSLTKFGTGTLTLSGNNDYSGATIVNGGALSITHNNALGSTLGSTTINGGNGTGAQSLTLTNATSDLVIAENLNFFGSLAGRAQLVNGGAFNHEFTGAIDVSSDTNLAQFSSGSTGSITISGDITGTLTNGSVLFLRGESTNALNRVIGSLNLTGGNLAKTDGGTWLVGVSGETYSWADTLIANGTLKMGLANVLPSATGLIMGNSTGGSNGSLDLNGFSQTVASITFSGAGTATGTKTITNSDLSNAAVFTINNATDHVSGSAAGTNNIVLTGNLGITKQGVGKLTLRGTNTYTGDTTISGGTLEMASNLIANSPDIFIGDGATLSGTGGFTLTANQSVTGTGATGNVTTSSASGLITAGNNIISNSVALDAGTLTLTRFSVLGSGNQITGGDIQSGGVGSNQRGLLIGNGGSGDLTITGGTLTSNGGNNNTRYDVLANTNAAGSPVATLTINGGNYVNTSGRTTLGNTGSQAGTATLTVTTGSATINELEYLMGSFAGNTATVNLDGGTLTVSSIISTSGTNRVFNFNGGQFVAGADLPAFSGLTLNVKDGGAKIDTNGNSFAIADAFLNDGAGGLTKSGAGTLTLSGPNTYIGGTTVSAGTLAVTGSLGATTVTVSNLATLAGNGNIGGNVTINSGATHALAVAATPGAQVTRAVTGTLTLTAGNLLDLTATAPPAAGEYVLATATSAITGAPTIRTGFVGGVVSVDTVSSPNRLLLTVASGGYASWINGFFPGETNPAIIGAASDPDNDGIDNAVEMVLGGNPANGMDTALLPTIERVNADPDGDTTFSDYLLFTYRRTDLSVTAGVTATCETDTDLVGPWTTAVGGVSGVVILTDDNFPSFTPPAANTDRVRVYVPRSANPKFFGRLNVLIP